MANQQYHRHVPLSEHARSDPQTHCYTLHFFSKVLLVSGDNVIYDYRDVVGWSDHIEGGLFNLKQLFVPINIMNTHWIFIRAHFESKTIEIYDSFGFPNHHYQKYLWAMRSSRQEQTLAKAGEHV